jgi:hypothetical protein
MVRIAKLINNPCSILFWILKTPGVLENLQAEIDDIILSPTARVEFRAIKDLP